MTDIQTLHRLLVVDDDSDIRNLLAEQLGRAGYAVSTAADGNEMRQVLAREHIDLIVLDLNLPREDGLALCRELRVRSTTPVIMLTAKGDDADRIVGLELGADDYVTKPFNFDELLARIKANIRKNAPETALNTHLVFKDVEIDLDAFSVKRQGQEITLSRTEFDLLYYLVLNHDLVQSREQILDKVWGFDYDGGDNIVDVYIKYLRDKIDRDFDEKLIQTVRGRGYVVR